MSAPPVRLESEEIFGKVAAMRRCVIFNPAARGEKARKFRDELQRQAGGWELIPTTGPGAARRLACEAVEGGCETVIAAGGDGTLNEVLNGIADARDGLARARLGVIPLGTINVFARELRLPGKVAGIWPVLENGRELHLDVGEAEFTRNSARERRLFIQLAGAGLDARAVELVDWAWKKRIGGLAYLQSGLKALAEVQPPITVTCGGRSAAGQMVLIGNGRLYGGDHPFLHKADLQDGMLDAALFRRMGWTAFPAHAFNFCTRRCFRDGVLEYLQGPELLLQAPSRVPFHVDGEPAGELPARVQVRPRALRVIAPPL